MTALPRSLTRADYAAVRREYRDLRRWLLLNPAPFTTGCDENAARHAQWQRKWTRAQAIGQLMPAPWKPGDGDVLDHAQRIRRQQVEQRVARRRRERAAAAFDTRGMSNAAAAIARVLIRADGRSPFDARCA